MTDNYDADAQYEILLLKFVVSAIIDHSHNRDEILKYIRSNLETFSSLTDSAQDDGIIGGKIKELLTFLESGGRRPVLSGKPPKLRIVRSDDEG